MAHDFLLQEYARKLRKSATEEENLLWYQFLRTYPIQFRRQKVIGRYIVDFFCSEARLIVEVDGGQHFEDSGRISDVERTEYLNRCEGFRYFVLQIWKSSISLRKFVRSLIGKYSRTSPHQSRFARQLPPKGKL